MVTRIGEFEIRNGSERRGRIRGESLSHVFLGLWGVFGDGVADAEYYRNSNTSRMFSRYWNIITKARIYRGTLGTVGCRLEHQSSLTCSWQGLVVSFSVDQVNRWGWKINFQMKCRIYVITHDACDIRRMLGKKMLFWTFCLSLIMKELG